MAKEQRTKAGWLERRRDRKREKVQQKATKLASQRGEEASAAERRTRGWDS